MRLGFFSADHARFDQPSHIGVVARHSRNLPTTDQVEASVANMYVIERVIILTAILTAPCPAERTPDDRRRRAGRSHAPQFRMRKAVFPDMLVGRLQSVDQRRLRVVAAKVT